MVLIDTSCWTQALRRKGDPKIAERVRSLLLAGEATWCEMIRLELWNGAVSDWDRESLRALEASLPRLPITGQVWEVASDLAHRARSKGVTVPATDIIIFACAQFHAVRLEHADRHFPMLEQL